VDSSGSGQDSTAGSYEHDNDPSTPPAGGKVLDQLKDYHLLEKDSAPWNCFIINLVDF
jgi:hypothetical protein